MSDPIIQIASLSKAFFGIHALRGVTLDVIRGHILAVIGQNGAGKSTLMNIIGGVVRTDSGSMRFDGAPYEPRNPTDATRAGIAFIHQELNLFTNLTIAENIFIDHFPRRGMGPFRVVNWEAVNARVQDLLAQVGLELKPDTLVERLAPGERQLVEIAKALHIDATTIIFDEPTTSLTARETERLFLLIAQLREAGKSLIYISHILGDVLQIADDIAVLRDGELVASGPKADFSVSSMITQMVGRPIENLYPPRQSEPSQNILLSTRRLSAKAVIHEVSLSLRGGEILGLFGLMGSGRTELARILFGLDAFDSGEIAIGERVLTVHSARESIRAGLAFITEDRREEGLLMSREVVENIALAALPKFGTTPLRIIELARLFKLAADAAETLQIKAGSLQLPAKSLSGGNQQKVVIAKWLMAEPSIFIMDEPTRGVDVGAKYEIYSIIDRLASDGRGILFISSEIEELMAMCDRILVMSQGEVVSEFARNTFDKERILRAAFREQEVAA
jgi:ribose transport system ATP-binding protein